MTENICEASSCCKNWSKIRNIPIYLYELFAILKNCRSFDKNFTKIRDWTNRRLLKLLPSSDNRSQKSPNNTFINICPWESLPLMFKLVIDPTVIPRSRSILKLWVAVSYKIILAIKIRVSVKTLFLCVWARLEFLSFLFTFWTFFTMLNVVRCSCKKSSTKILWLDSIKILLLSKS